VISLSRSAVLVVVFASVACGLELEGSFLVDSAPDAGDAGKLVTKDATVEAAVLVVVDGGSVADGIAPSPMPPAPPASPVYQWSCVKIAERAFDRYTQCEMARRSSCANTKAGAACASADVGKTVYNGCDDQCLPSASALSGAVLKYTDGSDARCVCEQK
jgi:hypothetical protein